VPVHNDAVRVVTTKWGDRPHWEFDAVFLGSDGHGDWLGVRAGTPMARPGAGFVTETDQVVLVPRPDAGGGAGWLAAFHAPGFEIVTYVDMTTVPVWQGTVCRAVDLDLDVVRGAQGDVFVDDEDEFLEHQVRHAYPADVVALARTSCAWVHDAVLNERAPFNGLSSARWLSVLGTTPAPGS